MKLAALSANFFLGIEETIYSSLSVRATDFLCPREGENGVCSY